MLDLAPFGFTIPSAHQYHATSLGCMGLIDGLKHLDRATMSAWDMLLPPWVLFDCAAFPGIIFGFAARVEDLPDYARAVYKNPAPTALVPVSMWLAVRCAEEGAWFGHTLASANVLLRDGDALPGLGLFTKILGIKLIGARRQYGATQWISRSLRFHLRLGEMELLGAYTPMHTHAATLSYCIEVNEAHLFSTLRTGWRDPAPKGDRVIDTSDLMALQMLHQELEAGARWCLSGVELRDGQSPRAHLRLRSG